MNIVHGTKIEIARSLLNELFSKSKRLPIADVVAAGREVGVSRRTLIRAKVDLGLYEVHNGPFGAFWEIDEHAAATATLRPAPVIKKHGRSRAGGLGLIKSDMDVAMGRTPK